MRFRLPKANSNYTFANLRTLMWCAMSYFWNVPSKFLLKTRLPACGPVEWRQNHRWYHVLEILSHTSLLLCFPATWSWATLLPHTLLSTMLCLATGPIPVKPTDQAMKINCSDSLSQGQEDDYLSHDRLPFAIQLNSTAFPYDITSQARIPPIYPRNGSWVWAEPCRNLMGQDGGISSRVSTLSKENGKGTGGGLCEGEQGGGSLIRM